MPTWLISLLVGIAAGAWAYSQLARLNGNAQPQSNAILAGVTGFIIFIVLFTLLKFTFGF